MGVCGGEEYKHKIFGVAMEHSSMRRKFFLFTSCFFFLSYACFNTT